MKIRLRCGETEAAGWVTRNNTSVDVGNVLAPSLGRGVGLVMVSGGFEGLMDLWGKVGAVPRFSEREEGR